MSNRVCKGELRDSQTQKSARVAFMLAAERKHHRGAEAEGNRGNVEAGSEWLRGTLVRLGSEFTDTARRDYASKNAARRDYA